MIAMRGAGPRSTIRTAEGGAAVVGSTTRQRDVGDAGVDAGGIAEAP
jgi:hypothetical protein